jgi:hypothetical protein
MSRISETAWMAALWSAIEDSLPLRTWPVGLGAPPVLLPLQLLRA